MTSHDETIRDQFSRQAAPFAQRHRRDDELIELLVEMSRVGTGDQVLDVACGPGIIACALATRAEHVTGIDLTPAMLAQARELQRDRGSSNLTWREGGATALPFADASFDCVVTRFSFHHFVDPSAVLREMVRTCRPGGAVLVCDVSPRAETCAAYDAMEKFRDPSHTMVVTESELEQMGRDQGLILREKRRYDLSTDVEGLLATSFPPAGGAKAFRDLIEADLAAGHDSLGIRAWKDDGEIRFYFPVLTLAWTTPKTVRDAKASLRPR